MMRPYKMVTAAALLALTAGCSDSTVDQEAEAQALMELSRKWSDQAASGNLEAVMEFWADDAVMLPPDAPILRGKEAIRGYVEAAMETPGFEISWEPISAHISDAGDMAYMIERNVTEFDGPDGNRVTIHGKVVTVWRRDGDGRWRNVVDMWNRAPAPTDE